MNKINKFLTAIICLLFSTAVWAGKEKMNARINAAGFTVGNTVAVTDNKFPNVTMSGNAVIKSSVARITLALDNTYMSLNYLGSGNTYLKVGVKISYTDATGNSFSQIKEMTINHNATGITGDRSNVVIKNAHSVIARILYFKNASNVIVPSPLIPSNIFLETEIETERYYPLNVSTLPNLNHFYYSASNELEIHWNSVSGAEEYELEYTYVNDIAASSTSYSYDPGSGAISVPSVINPISSASLPFTFNNNATRIRTSQNSFKITLNYNRGMIVYRIRTVGRLISNPDLEVFGNWTINQPQTQLSMVLPGSPNDFYVITTGHEENKNWQATTTFAEDGKKKDVIGYFDGSNHKRQTVTRTNTENTSLVGETFYDSQGRPAVTVLPSPNSNYSSEIKFFENFNQSAVYSTPGSPMPYSRFDFETTSTLTCPVPANGMYTAASNANGASVYYSANNSNKQNQNAYIPDAKQFPFTHNTYAPDNTGTVRFQSGVGNNHKVGSGHETKNIEGDPDQEDLDKLFGSEAGYAEKYKKNMTVDANGQISVNYSNTEGKTVATALAGNSPTNVTQLSSLNVYAKSATYVNSSDGNYASVNLAANGALTFKKKIIPDITGTYNFFYDITLPQYTDACIPSFCYDCAYDLSIKITDECNATIYTQTATVGQPVNFTCGAPIYFSSTGFTPAFNSVLTAGKEYFLTKVLTINNDGMNQYLNHYLNTANNTCIKDLNYFSNLELASVDYGDCHMTCVSCTTKVYAYYATHSLTALGSTASPTYDPNYVYMSPTQLQQAIDKCMKPCTPLSLCQTEFETMLQDMRPSGQYAQYTESFGAYVASGYDLSIFNQSNKLRLSTIFLAPTVGNGTPFVPYTINSRSSCTNPEYYNTTTHSFSSPDPGATKDHYFDANGNLSKIRLVVLPSGGFYPAVINTSTPAVTSAYVPGIYTDNIGVWTTPENLLNLKDFIFAYSNNPQWAYSLVKNHPEFNYFLDCDRQSNATLYSPAYTSEQFDFDLRKANSMAEGMGTVSGGINFGQGKWALTLTNGSLDLLGSDPYFKIGAPGNALFSTMSARLTNYQASGFPLKQICAQMYSSAQMYYSTCASAATFGSSSIVCSSVTYPIPTASLDMMWKSYRDMYLIEKQKLLMETAHTTASNPGGNKNNYYNGAIGDQNFTPWPSYANYGFFPFFIPSSLLNTVNYSAITSVIQNIPTLWPDYTASSPNLGVPNALVYHPTFANGYFDFGSPSSIYHKARYANKIRRVPDTQTLSNALAGGATDPASMMANLNNQAEAEIFAATGQCPIYKRLELFLSTIAKKGTLFNFGVTTPLVSEPAFTKQVYDAIVSCGGLTPSAWIPIGFTPTQVGNVVTIKFYNLTSGSVYIPNADITLTNISGTTIGNWNDVKAFKDIQFNGTVASSSAFTLKALYQTGTNPYEVLKFKGTTCIQSNCPQLAATVNAQTCKPTQQALELQNFLSAVVNDYTITAITKPINLGNFPGNNSSNYFTSLVRYPFSSAAVNSPPSAISHSVSITNFVTSSVINLMGKDAAAQTINVSFLFTPTIFTVTPQDLNGALSLANIQPAQSPSAGYDFSIRAYYAGGVTQVFNVTITYPAGLCASTPGFVCMFYNLKKCESFVSGSCENNPNYKTKLQLQDLMNEICTYPAYTNIPSANLSSYTNLLQSQFGPGNNNFSMYTANAATSTVGLTSYSVIINEGTVADCRITLSTISNVPTFLFNTNLVFSNIFALNAPSSNFTVSATDGLNTYTFTGITPCLKLDNCDPCNLDSLVHQQTFESYTNQTTTAALNFSTARFDPTTYNPAVACTFIGATCSPNTFQPIANFGDVSIQSTSACMGFNDHTPGTGTKYLESYVLHPSGPAPATAYVEPWKNLTPLTTVVGKNYSVSFWMNYANDNNIYRVQLIVNDGTNDIVLVTKDVDCGSSANYTPFINVWQAVTATYNANSTTSTFKIRVTPLTSAFGGSSSTRMQTRIAIDDIVIKKLGCEKETAVPIAADPDEDDCVNQLTNIALANAQQKYNLYINNVKKDFKEAYTKKCYQTLEKLTAAYQSSEGHYTLYYYDQAGNLIKTVPPEGVEPINLSAVEPLSGLTYAAKIKSDRDNKTKTVFTDHRMATRYEYNSLNQLIRQSMPDHVNGDLYSTTYLTPLPPSLQVISMDFSNASQGCMIGNNGSGTAVYVTNNGGASWTQASSGLTGANIIDIDYSGSTAYGILSDGTILKSTNYTTGSPTWQSITLPGSNTMQFTDIEFYNTNNGYITGKNGLLLSTSDAGVTWTQINLNTLNDLNKIDFKNDGPGFYGVVVGNSGSVFYITPSNLSANIWNPFPNLNTNIDVLNASIVTTGNGSSSYLNTMISGVDRNYTVKRGTVINLFDVNGPAPAINNLYVHNNASAYSKITALATNTYVIASTSYIDVLFGGELSLVTPTPILNKLQYTSTVPTYQNIALTTAGIAYTSVSDLIINGVGSSSYYVQGVTKNGKYINVTGTTATGYDLYTAVSVLNTAPLNRINIDPSVSTKGLIAGDMGTILSYNTSTGLTSQAQGAVSFPTALNSITAAKDASGIVYAVGNSGTMVRSANFGGSWQVINTGLSGSINLMAAKYITSSPAKLVIAGNAYVGKVDPITSVITPVTAANSYKSIATAAGNPNLVFVAGSNGANAAIDNFLLSASAVSPVGGLSGAGLNKIDFFNTGIAYAVGNTGNILKSVNNGSSFSALTSGTSNNLNDLVIQDQYNAFAFGVNSTVLKTTDAGSTWALKSTPYASNITSVYNFGGGNMLVAGNGVSNLFSISDQSADYSTRFFYDALGRLIISQNAKQYNKVPKAYSYTIYDALGRISAVGEIAGASLANPALLANNGVIPLASFSSWLGGGTKTEVTTTVYDNAVTTPCSFTQDNLRKRVSATYIDNDNNLGNGYTHATYYNYDIHGNVKSLMQENPAMGSGQTCKRIDYSYDLISGKVNQVNYQYGQPDAYSHKYYYDADNRITNVFTSKDGIDWQQDAKYFYYLHGPLARTEIGNDKVQGMDFAYTIQGWIKGINSMALNINNDIGKDGAAGTAYNSAIADLNKYISYDAAGYALSYFASSGVSDYTAIDATKNTSTNRFDGDISSHSHFTTANSLYNGNIMAMATGIYTSQPVLASTNPAPLLNTYKYDQLNRIKQANTTTNVTANVWSSAAATSNYKNYFIYDANGNIEKQKRYDNTATVIDSMTYKYHVNGAGKKISNRLYHVNDAASGAASVTDIDDQGAFTAAPTSGIALGQINSLNNYSYDETGRLIKDVQEGIANIEWTAYGRIKTITRTALSTSKNIIFSYDSWGNRISKTTFNNGQPTALWETTFYIRDPEGNLLCTYDSKPIGGSGPQNLNLTEHILYGSKRIGARSYLDLDNLNTLTTPYSTSSNSYTMELKGGTVNYEITNHLENVITVISDRKIPFANVSTPTVVDHFVADISSSNDHYVFGAPMPGRTYVSSGYRFGYNGKEKDDEVKGNGNSLDFGARIYDSRLGRFISLDYFSGHYPDLSPFAYAQNNPIRLIDVDGDYPGDPFGLTWQQLSGAAILNGVWGEIKTKYAALDNQKQWNLYKQRLGRIFEAAVLKSIDREKNTLSYNGRIPDAIAGSSTAKKEYDPVMKKEVLKYYWWDEGTFIDAKTSQTQQVTLTDQIKEFINTLSENDKAEKGDAAFATAGVGTKVKAKASKNEAAFLHIITPVGTKITDELVQYATSKGVILWHSETNATIEINPETKKAEYNLIVNPKKSLNFKKEFSMDSGTGGKPVKVDFSVQ